MSDSLLSHEQALLRLSQGFRMLRHIGDGVAVDGAMEIAAIPDDDTSRAEIEFDEWDWEVGVGLYGEYRRCTGIADGADRLSELQRLARWYERQIARGLPRKQVNSTAPMLTLALLALHEQESGSCEHPHWHTIVHDWANWLVVSMPKTAEGGFQHTVKERDNDGELWDDTLFMAALFLAVAGELCQRPDWIDEAHYQFLLHIRYLGDVTSGLFFHGWTFNGHHHFAGALWCRGNAWVTLAIPELFRLAPPDGAVARQLKATLQTQAEALARLQREDGMFHTLLDDPRSPIEASGTAGIACGLLSGMREGLLEPGYADTVERARKAILSRIDKHGLLQDVSDGTAMGHDLEHYRRIPNLPTPYGQSLASLFLIELDALT